MSEHSAPAKAQDEGPVEEKKSGRKHTEPSFNMDELQALAALVNEHGFTDFEFENENIRVRLSKATAQPVYQAMAAVPVQHAAPAASSQSASASETSSEAAPDPDAGLYKITSPIVGTFYRSPGPDKDPYVSEGSTVSAESTVCIVEAMKLMNEIQAEVSGTIVRIYAENGQPVEYGQPLFGVKK